MKNNIAIKDIIRIGIWLLAFLIYIYFLLSGKKIPRELFLLLIGGTFFIRAWADLDNYKETGEKYYLLIPIASVILFALAIIKLSK